MLCETSQWSIPLSAINGIAKRYGSCRKSSAMPSLPLRKAARFEDLVAYVDHRSHPFFACRTCQVAVPLDTISSHFSTLKIHNYRAGDVRQLADAWVKMHLPSRPVSLVAFDDLLSWPCPRSPPYPPPLLFLPVYYGLHCTFRDPATGARCTAIKQRHKDIVKHCATEHQWVNPVARGNRPTDTNIRDRPWEAHVPCQRLRRTGVGGELFRVTVEEPQPPPVAETPSGAAKGRTWAELEAELDTLHAEGGTRRTLATPNTTGRYPIHMSAWLEKTGWPVYLEGRDLRAVARLLEPPAATEPGLRALLLAFDELIDEARQSILDEEVNMFALHRVNSFIPNRPFRKPLRTKLLESTYRRYKKTWHRLLSYVYRLTVLRQGPDLHYVLTPAQQLALHEISTAATDTPSVNCQPANPPPSRPQTPAYSESVLSCDSSPPPPFLFFKKAGLRPDTASTALSLVSTPPPALSSPPAFPKPSRARRTQRSAEGEEVGEGLTGSEGGQSCSEFNLSRSSSPTASFASQSACKDAGLHSTFSAAIEEAFRSSPAATLTDAAPATAGTTSEKRRQACLQLCIALLDHKLKGKVTDSIVVGFLAANGINRERTGFEEAVTATSPLSALVKLAQLLVVQHALCRHRAGQRCIESGLLQR
ncbi:hypothetical protein DM02DRAFT_635580 [Periconia macrospinosa]|uniref:Uncharacterized protein n=1 Tax=Periconia macrospinosa TaxID=97972 RepID=A0A2V1D3W7_9PLEO|nr:hypothetical protein DM02DRAFT_635580 [Periconia macrospinosa]